ncbi:MAG: TAXI family TRAP transporter solute-binding subunit, partial [Tagaea sp.]|nr:TAXI family TRAP transporter solute-binding subunit [Tagaea sp.]
ALGKPHANVRALFAMYRTGYHGVALRGRNVGRVLDLDSKRVGVGPAGGPAELFFGAMAREFHMTATSVTGSPAELGQALIDGRIDAFFQGAIVPIPALATVAERADSRMFGLSAWEIARLVERYRYLSPMIVPAGTYRGQDAHLATVASWNFAVVHKDLPDARAEAILRAVLRDVDPAKDIHPFAADTRAANAAQNRVIPFHPAALRFHREAGVAVR